MRHFTVVFIAMLLLSVVALAQDHIPVPHTIPHGTTRICWGYAMGVAGGKSSSDACNPETLIPDDAAISSTYFNQYDWSTIDTQPLQAGDILYWPGTHAAYVTSVTWSGGHVVVNSIGVSHMSASQWSGVISESLADAKTRVGVGNPSYFCRVKQISITVSNSFGGGNVTVAGNSVSSGSSVSVDWWHTISLQAVNQDYSNVYRIWTNWQKSSEGSPTTTNPRTITAGSGDSYTANFSNWSDISFATSLPGGSGGTLSVWDTTRSAPGTVRMPQNTSFYLTASTLEINRIIYTFSQWSGSSTSSNYQINPTASQHLSYTANYTAKPDYPDNISVAGSVGNPVYLSWSEHPHTSVTQYKIWRKVKRAGQQQEDSPELIATVNRGTTTYTDNDCTVTNGYTDDLVWYDVRSYFSVNSTTSDPNWNAIFADYDPAKAHDTGDPILIGSARSGLPTDYLVSNYPNPFNPSTTISYQLVDNALVTLIVYDMMGREIQKLVNTEKPVGYYSVQWSGRDSHGNLVASGIYLYRFVAAPTNGRQPFTISGKLLLSK